MDRKTLLLLVISVLILLVMLWFVGIDKVIDALKVANLGIIALAIATQVFTYFLYTLRWEILNKLADMDLGIKNCFRWFWSVLPLTISLRQDVVVENQ